MWLGILILLGGLVALQFRGAKAMKDLGVAQPKIVMGMKIVNVTLVIAVVIWALWEWVV